MKNDKKTPFRGAATALITPFSETGIDFDALARLIEFQITSGIDALVVCGTTGESPTLTKTETEAVISFAVEKTGGRVPVIAGAGCADTESSVVAARDASRLGADAVMTVTPYYSRPPEDGLYAHFASVADASAVPVIAYNVPSRTGSALTHALCRRLARHGNVSAIKEASGTLSLAEFCINELDGGLAVYSGTDSLNLPMLALGADGVISVVSNAFPSEAASMCHAVFNGDLDSARAIARRLYRITDALFRASNPIPIKALMSALGFCENRLRLPLSPLPDEDVNELLAIFSGN